MTMHEPHHLSPDCGVANSCLDAKACHARYPHSHPGGDGIDYTDWLLAVGVEGDLFNLHRRGTYCGGMNCVQATQELVDQVLAREKR